MMESPDEAREMACPIVLHAVVGDEQLLLSLPVTPLTYQTAGRQRGGYRHARCWKIWNCQTVILLVALFTNSLPANNSHLDTPAIVGHDH